MRSKSSAFGRRIDDSRYQNAMLQTGVIAFIHEPVEVLQRHLNQHAHGSKFNHSDESVYRNMSDTKMTESPLLNCQIVADSRGITGHRYGQHYERHAK
jgi:hypothetical protein